MKHLSKMIIVVWVTSFLVTAPLPGRTQQSVEPPGGHVEIWKGLHGHFSLNANVAARIMQSSAGYQYLEQAYKEVHFAARDQESVAGDQTGAGAPFLESSPNKPPLTVGRFIGELSAGIAGGIGMSLLVSPFHNNTGFWRYGPAALILFVSTHTLGSAIGVYLAGNSGNQRGSFGSALMGSILGEFVSFVILFLTRGEGASPVMFVGVPLFATLFFNSSRRYRVAPASRGALLNIKKGKMSLGMPVCQVLPEDPLTRSRGFSLRLMNLEW